MGKLVKPLTPHEIYEKLRVGNTQLLDDAQVAARNHAEEEADRAQLIRKQAELLQSGWEGAAGDAASGGIAPRVENAMTGAIQLGAANVLMESQSGAFHHAANSVRPVAAEPPKMDIGDMLWPFVDYERQVTDYQADAQHNIDVFRGYDTASEGHESGMKPYTIVDDSGGTVTVGDTGDQIEVPDGGPPRDERQSGPFGGRRDPGNGPGTGPDSGPGSVPVGGPGFQQPQQTSPSDFVTRPVGTGPLPGGQPVPTGQAPGGPMPGAFVPVGGFPSGGPGSTGGPGRRGGPYGPGPGAGGPGTAGRAPWMRSGTLGAGPLAAEEAAAQRAAAAAATRGGSGMMGGAPVGARGKGDEDEEHQRKVLIEADAEGLFGSDVLTAPQVIGDDEYEDD